MRKSTLIRLVRNSAFFMVSVWFVSAAAKTSETKVQGVLFDKMCSYKAETRIVPGPRLAGGITTIYPHTRQCALMPECQKSGYGVFTYDQKFLPFDEAANQKALAYFKQAKREDDFRVEVAGQIQGEVLKVATIKPLP
jgi:hypothetical protein